MKNLLVVLLTFGWITSRCFAQPQWDAQNSGTNNELAAVSFVDQNNGWVSGNIGIMLHTTDGGQTWNLRDTPANWILYSVVFTDLQNGWAAGYGGEVVHTTDGGENWSLQENLGYDDIYKLFFMDVNKGWAAGGSYDFQTGIRHRVIYNTTDGGNNWNLQYGMAYKSQLHGIYFVDSTTGYAAGESGIIMKTTDGGNQWVEQQNITGFDFSGIFFATSSTGFVAGEYLGVPHYSVIFRTTDGGSNWSETQLGTDEILASICFTDSQNGWAVGNDYDGGNNLALIYRTTDGGNNWVKQNIPSFDALAGVFFIDGAKGWAVGHLGTILSTQTPLAVDVNNGIPKEFSLGQNYPNPFNPSTNIAFRIPSKAFVSLTIYDILGRGISTLVSGELSAGDHHAQWDASGFPSGIYFYRLRAGGFTETRKMLLLR